MEPFRHPMDISVFEVWDFNVEVQSISNGDNDGKIATSYLNITFFSSTNSVWGSVNSDFLQMWNSIFLIVYLNIKRLFLHWYVKKRKTDYPPFNFVLDSWVLFRWGVMHSNASSSGWPYKWQWSRSEKGSLTCVWGLCRARPLSQGGINSALLEAWLKCW